MIAVLKADCRLRDKALVVRTVEQEGFRVLVSEVDGRTYVGVVGPGAGRIAERLEGLPAVDELRREAPAYPLVSLQHNPARSHVRVGGKVVFGGAEVPIIGGPCSVENEAQILAAAHAVKAAGGTLLRGGAFKPRTSPYSFQGLGEEGLRLLALARAQTGLPIVTEVVAPDDVPLVSRYADVLQIGARNMQNFRLLQAAGQSDKPVLLKRGMMATIEELLHSAEYVMSSGNPRVMLCLRGIRTFEKATRNTFDIAAVPLLKEKTHLPVVVDPSHACGIRSLIPALARAAVAVGADGLIVEMHPKPEEALSDGAQSLTPELFAEMMAALGPVAEAVGRERGGYHRANSAP
jgi:3-deoxy-7-phosphoheptulonate synthase